VPTDGLLDSRRAAGSVAGDGEHRRRTDRRTGAGEERDRVDAAQQRAHGDGANTDLQRWWIDRGQRTGAARLVNVGTGRCLTVDPNSTSQNPYLLVYTCGTQPRQHFRLVNSPRPASAHARPASG